MIGKRGFYTFEWCFTVTELHRMGVRWTLHNSGHRLALCHVFDMSCLGKVHVAASYRKYPEFEIP